MHNGVDTKEQFMDVTDECHRRELRGHGNQPGGLCVSVWYVYALGKRPLHRKHGVRLRFSRTIEFG